MRALSKAGVPSIRELHGLTRLDGKRPNGRTLIPWCEGRNATWDVTVINTVAASYLSASSSTAASAAESAVQRKEIKYAEIYKNPPVFPSRLRNHWGQSTMLAKILSRNSACVFLTTLTKHVFFSKECRSLSNDSTSHASLTLLSTSHIC